MKKNIIDLYNDVTKVYHHKISLTDFDLKKDLPPLIQQFEILIKPDYVFVMDLRSDDPNKRVVFEKNYRLKSDKGEVNLEMIMNSITPENVEKIIEIDKISAGYTLVHYKFPFQYRMNVGFPVELVKNNPQYLLRTAMVISHGEDGLPYHALAFLRDISVLCNQKKNIEFFISGGYDEDETMLKLKEDLTRIIKVNLILTRQEKNILQMVKEGLTSQQIGEKLFISKYTVDTHRQNIIKKLGVHNSQAALQKAVELGLIE